MKTKTCTSSECPERTGGECTAGEERYLNWPKEFKSKFFVYKLGDKFPDHVGAEKEAADWIEGLLIEILAKCESADDARQCRHIIKKYILQYYE